MHVEVYTPRQLADALHVSVGTVQRWLRDGRIVGYKISQGWLIKVDTDTMEILDPDGQPHRKQ